MMPERKKVAVYRRNEKGHGKEGQKGGGREKTAHEVKEGRKEGMKEGRGDGMQRVEIVRLFAAFSFFRLFPSLQLLHIFPPTEEGGLWDVMYNMRRKAGGQVAPVL